jgi:hypothetical protein
MTITTERPIRRHDRAGMRPRVLVVGIALAVTVVLALWGCRWWTHPDLLADHGDRMSMDPRPVAEAARAAGVTFPETADDPTTLTFHSARGVLGADSARSKVSFFICRKIPGEDPIGFVNDGLSAYCSDVRPIVDGTRLSYPDSQDYLVVVLTPTHPGRSRLVRVDLNYSLDRSHLFRHGTDTVAMDMTVRATR